MSEHDQSDLSRKARSVKRGNEKNREYLVRQNDTPDEGAVKGLNPDAPVEGAFDAEGHRPVLERSRKVR